MTRGGLPARYATACVVLVACLVMCLFVWQLSLYPLTAIRLGVLVALAVPLLAAVPGLRKRRAYTARWASLLTIAYIALALVETTVNPDAKAVASTMAVLSFALFCTLIVAVRRAT